MPTPRNWCRTGMPAAFRSSGLRGRDERLESGYLQRCEKSRSGRLTAFTGFEKIKRDRCSPHVHGSCPNVLSRSVEFGLRLNLCQLDQSSHVRA